MENRGALRFVSGTVTRQPNQRRQSACTRSSPRAEPCGHGTSSGSLNPTAKPDLPWRAVSRLRSKLGAPKAITAMAHRLPPLVYRMLKYGQQYVDKGAEYYERRHRQQQIEFIRKKAAQLGLKVTLALA